MKQRTPDDKNRSASLSQRFMDLSQNNLFPASPPNPFPLLHGMEMEGFVIDQQGQLVPKATNKIMALMQGTLEICDESGTHQIEYTSDPVIPRADNFQEITTGLREKRKKVEAACRQLGYHFIARALPFYLPQDPESHEEYFNNTGSYERERTYFNSLEVPRPPYFVKSREGKDITKFTDSCFSLAFVCGNHSNFSFADLETAVKYFNAFVEISPFICALAANGGFVNEPLAKADYRLHCGVLSEDLLNHDYVNDIGLPDRLKDWQEYLQRQIQKPFIDDYPTEPTFVDLFDSLREISWSFVQMKVFPNGPGIEFRPISAQPTTDASVALHMLTTWLSIFITTTSPEAFTQREELGRGMQSALTYGSKATVPLLGKRKTVDEHLDWAESVISSMVSKISFMEKESVDAVFKTLRHNLILKKKIDSDPAGYIRYTADDPFIA